MTKKLTAILLTIVLLMGVCSPLGLNAAAATPAPLPFRYCDSPLDWVNGAYPTMQVKADNQFYTEAPASLHISGDGGMMILYTILKEPIDISPYTYLEFDFYTPDVALLKQGSGQLELSSSGGCDVAEAASSPFQIFDQVTTSGWNHIRIPLNTFGKFSSDPTRVFDNTAVNFFRFYLIGIPAGQTYSFHLDNMVFSNGQGWNPTPVTPEDYTSGTPCKNNGYQYGDVLNDGELGAKDALAVLQYVVGSRSLKNKELAMAEVTADGDISSLDALHILRYVVGKTSQFDVETETLPEKVEVGINAPHLVHTKYPTQTRVVAETDVVYWGAKGDGVTDDTLAFQKALYYAGGLEGGTVFVPAGNYAIHGNLTIPNGVTLQGDSPKVSEHQKAEGTILMAFAGRGNADGTPFITMDSASAIANLSIWYPEQTADNITPYPWTIRQGGHYGIALSNVRLVNSYQGIGMFYTNSLQNIRNVVGTPLKTGLILDGNVDICRVENVSFTPECWLNSGLGEPQNPQKLKDYLYSNAIGFRFEHVDWTYVTDITAKNYSVALCNSKPSTRVADNAPNGHVFNVNFEDCYIGYHARYVNAIGMMITKGTIHAQIPVLAENEFETSFSLNHLDLIAEGDKGIYSKGSGAITVENCRITVNGGTGIQMDRGQLSATLVEFEDCQTHIVCKSGVTKGFATNCMTKDTLIYEGNLTPVWNESLTVADFSAVEEYDYNQEAVTFTAGDHFADITKAPYNADTTNTTDIAPLIQKALDDVATAGGGVVYLPSGRYRLDSPITVPTGVELKGSCTFPQHSNAYATTFYTTYGKGEEKDAQALITLSPKSGINGFKVYYDQQKIVDNTCDSYPFTVRGQGINNYILNVDFINSAYQTDLATNACDGHYINGATGCPLRQGIVVGGGSKHGVVRDCQFNIHYFSDNPHYQTQSANMNAVFQYVADHSDAFVVQDTTHQTMYHNFVFGAHSGLLIEDGADVFVLAHGTDGGDRSMTVRGTPSGKITMVNSQLVVITPGAQRAYINIEESFTGTVDMTQTNLWGNPADYSILVGGGTLRLSQGTNVRSGNIGARIWNNANLFLDTVNHMRSDPLFDYAVEDADQVVTFGNLYASGGTLLDRDKSYDGIESLTK